MSIRQDIERVLSERFTPTRLEISDESERHRGHSGWREGGETHFRVTIASPALEGLSRVAQHRAINEALAGQFQMGLHALQIKVVEA